MKKINSILAIAAVALTSVVGFTSCDKNDDSFNNQTPVVKGTSDNSNKSDDSNASTDSNASGNLLGTQQANSITLGSGIAREIGKTFEEPYAPFTVSNPEGLEVTVSSSDDFMVVSPEYIGGSPSNETTSFKTSEKSFVVYVCPMNKFDFSKAGTTTITLSDSKSTKKVTVDYKNVKGAIVGNTAWASWAFTFQSVAQ